MCVSMLARVVRVDSANAVVDANGVERSAGTRLYPDIRVGEWVLIGAGTIVQRLTDHEARDLRGESGAQP